MPRKQRKEITKESYTNIISTYQADKYSIKEISKMFSLDRKTIGNIIKKHESGEQFMHASEKRKRTCKIRNTTFTETEQIIYNSVAVDNSLVLQEISDKICENELPRISKSTVCRKLAKMQFTRKRLTLVPIERNTLENINARAIYAMQISQVRDGSLIFLDETGFSQHTCRRYGYSPRNVKAFISVPANKGINRSLMCVIGVKGVICHDHRLGAYNSASLVKFIETKLALHFEAHPNHILIMDNAAFHKSTLVKNALREHNISHKYLVPYSPELNPIEEFFAMLKSKFHALRSAEKNLSVEDCLARLLEPRNTYEEQCNGFYRNMRAWVDKARRREHFI